MFAPIRCLLVLILPLLLLTAWPACSQPTNVCITVRQAAKIADSLAVLPLVRREANSLRLAATSYRLAADSALAASRANAAAYRAETMVAAAERRLGESETARADLWRRRARHRGLLNWLGAAAAAGCGYFFLFK